MNEDLERRFGGLRRLHGDDAYQRLRKACVVVVGLGGVGSWACAIELPVKDVMRQSPAVNM